MHSDTDRQTNESIMLIADHSAAGWGTGGYV